MGEELERLYLHTSWGVDDGVPETAVQQIAFGPEGQLWVGGTETVATFDGLRFNRLDAFAKLPCNGLTDVFPDSAGRVWFATRNCGVLVYERGQMRRFPSAQSGSEVVVKLEESPTGELWSLHRRGLGRLSPAKDRFELLSGTNELSFLDLLAVGKSELLGVTQSGLYRVEQARLSRVVGVDFPSSKAEEGMLYQDAAGALWIGLGEEGLFHLSPAPQRVLSHYTDKDGLPGSSVRAATVGPHGDLWFATNRGIARFKDGRFSAVLLKGMQEENVQTLLFDREGNLFYGTFSNGLHQLRERTVWTLLQGLNAPSTWAVHEDREGAIWVGTEQGGLHRFKGQEVTLYGREQGLPDTLITSIGEDSTGALWVGTLAGLVRRDPVTGVFRTYSTEDGLPSMRAYTVLEEPPGTLTVGTADGLARKEGERFVRVDLPPALKGVRVRHLVADGEGGLWAGSAAGLLHLTKQGQRLYRTADGLGSDAVSSLLRDSVGDLWVGTANGLSRLRGGKLQTAQMKDGLLDRNILALQEDADGNLWAGSLSGIWRILRSDIDAFFEGKRSTVDTLVLSSRDGMVSPECNNNSTSASMRAKDGRIYMVTMAGVAIVDPQSFQAHALPLAPQVTSVVHDRVAWVPAQVKPFAPGTRDLEVNYTAPTFRDARAVRFRYRLLGYDRDWIDAGARRQAFYTHVPPGTYQFEVMARSKEGLWSKTAAPLTLTLLPHFYETRWFAAVTVLSALTLAGAAYALRIRMLKRREQELLRHNEELGVALATAKEAVRLKSEFVANVSHELRTPLNSIVNVPEGLLELFEERPELVCNRCGNRFSPEAGEESLSHAPCPECREGQVQRRQEVTFNGDLEELVRHLKLLVRSGRHLVHVVNDVLDFSKLDAGKMKLELGSVPAARLLETVEETMRPFAKEKGVVLKLLPAPEGLQLRVDEGKCVQVLMNLVSNALKFSNPGGQVVVGAERGDTLARLWVKDSGVGIAPEHHATIFESFRQVDGGSTRKVGGTGLGLAISRELVELHGGTLSLTSTLGEGSTFYVTLPRDDAEPSAAATVG